MKIIGFLLATASINVKLNTKMGNNNLGPVADRNEHPANLAPGYNTDTRTQALALDPEAVGGDLFDSGDICRISVQGAS